MKFRRRLLYSLSVLIFGVGIVFQSANGAEATPIELDNVGITEHLGKQVSPDLFFKNEIGEEVKISSFFDAGKPILLTVVYYECPMLCGLLLNGVTDVLSRMLWTVGNEFEVVTVSMDPTEGPELAQQKKNSVIEAYGRSEGAKGWHFLTGNKDQIEKLTNEVGFGYKYDEVRKEFAHSAAVMLLSPTGKVSRYLYGVQFEPREMKLGLLEASQGKVGTVLDKLLLFCYHYDPVGKKYSIAAVKMMKVAGGITVFGLGIMIWSLRRGRKQG